MTIRSLSEISNAMKTPLTGTSPGAKYVKHTTMVIIVYLAGYGPQGFSIFLETPWEKNCMTLQNEANRMF